MDGAQLYADVLRYESFGVHRFGSPGAAAALAWIEAGLRAAGLAVTSQSFEVARQYDFASGTLEAAGERRAVVPQWWIPQAQASFRLGAPVAKAGDAAGGFARLSVPYDNGAYLGEAQRQALALAFARRPAAVLLTIDHQSGEIFTYNVDQTSEPRPVPVILVAPRDRGLLDAAEHRRTLVTVEVDGRYRHGVEGRNVVGRLDRGRGRWIVVSTPVTSWFTSSCERGPGIAGFLATARLAAARWPRHDLAFVATAGHEIGHGGMERFLQDGAPPPAATAAWAHFGATLASRDALVRLILRSTSLEALTDRRFAGVDATRLVGAAAAVGELREVHGAGYPHFFGMAGAHRHFHTPADTASGTGPDLLAPVMAAFAATLDGIEGLA